MRSEIAVETRMWLICKKVETPISVRTYEHKLSTNFITLFYLQKQVRNVENKVYLTNIFASSGLQFFRFGFVRLCTFNTCLQSFLRMVVI